MPNLGNLDEDAALTIRSHELAISQKETLTRVAVALVRNGSSEFEFGLKRFLLTKNGQSDNPGYQIETENLDGSGRFRNSWSALSGDEDWQITCITNQVARLMASYEAP